MAMNYALAVGGFDQIWCLPCWDHSFGKTLIPFEQRAEMMELAVRACCHPKVTLARLESVYKTRFTIDLIDSLARDYPHHKFTFIIGEDNWRDRERWERWEQLQQKVEFFVIGREGTNSDRPFSMHLPPISSTEIREMIRSGRTDQAQWLVPQPVLDYIQNHGLYQER
jgi:nicotinate (nicotinamide) nucleotide adenylyltransferase